MNTVGGYAMSSWERGYGDMMFDLDLATLRLLPWVPGAAMVQCDLSWLDGSGPVTPVAAPGAEPVRSSARPVTGGRRWPAPSSSSSSSTTRTSRRGRAGYTGLTPSNQYNVDYSILGTTRIEPLLRDIRNGMYAAGLVVESAKGECNLGQHEIAFKFADVITTGDNHSLYKNGAKEIAALHGKALTFMAKFNEREGNSCHIHMSLRGLDGVDGLRR